MSPPGCLILYLPLLPLCLEVLLECEGLLDLRVLLLLDDGIGKLLVLRLVLREVVLDLLEVTSLLALVLSVGQRGLVVDWGAGFLVINVFEIIVILIIKSRSNYRRFLCLCLDFLGVGHKIDVFVGLREVQKMKTALDLVCFLGLYHTLEAYQSDILVCL